MSGKIPVKLIMSLLDLNISQNQMAKSRNVSKNSIREVTRIAKSKNITYSDIIDLSDTDAYKLFFPNKYKRQYIYQEVDYIYIHKELVKVGVNLTLLHNEYKADCKKNDTLAMSYDKFCKDYKGYTINNNLVNHVEHQPGNSVELDWSGPTIHLITSKGIKKIYLFVAVLPYSQFSYVEACLDMTEQSWLLCNIHLWEFLGGVTRQTIIDNLKTGVIKHPREGEVILNDNYSCLAQYYRTAVIACGVLKPRHKPSAESTVRDIASAIIAPLRNKEYTDFELLKADVKEKLQEFNTNSFQKKEGSRESMFLEEEKPTLRPLPLQRYDIGLWLYNKKVDKASFITYKKNFYSCPNQYVGEKIDIKINEKTIEMFYKNERIKSHKLFSKTETNRYRRDPKDFPDYFSKLVNSSEVIREKSVEIGPNTLVVIDNILSYYAIEEQGYNACRAVLRLKGKYSSERLEYACKYALTREDSPRYKLLQSILSNGRDLPLKNIKEKEKPKENKPIGHLRGYEYYKKQANENKEGKE